MKTIERVRLSAIKPNESNPRADFGDIAELADSIRATGGEPVNPIVCVRDANALFIVDGERRYRALKEIYGDEDPEVSVTVVDGWKEGNEVLAMLATDNKKRLSKEEMSRGYQLAFDLGANYINDTQLSMSTGASSESVMHARQTWGRLGKAEREKYAQCSLDQLAAAQEFDGKDFEAVLRAKPESWFMKAQNLREARAAREIAEKAMDICAMAGIEWIESKERNLPEGLAALKAYNRLGEKELAGLAGDIAETGATALFYSHGAWFAECRLAGPAKEKAPEPDPAVLERDRAHGIIAELKERLLLFLANAKDVKALRRIAATRRAQYRMESFQAELEENGMDPNRAAELLTETATFYELYATVDGLAVWSVQDWPLRFLPAAEADGFEPNDDEQWLMGYLEREGK